MMQNEDDNGEIINIRNPTEYNILGLANKVKYLKRRLGNPEVMVANYHNALNELDWKPEHSLFDIINSAWDWHPAYPQGYRDLE